MKKLSIFSILLLVALLLAGGCKNNEENPLSGKGTKDKPYLINNAADLEKFSELINTGTAPYANTGKNYRLTADISMPTSTTIAGNTVNLTPIGTEAKKFCGNFDGNGKTISGLTIKKIATNFIGLFGCVEGGSIKNLGLTNVDIKGYYRTGGIAGSVTDCNITGCYVTGTVSGVSYIGGIAGEMENSSITYCYVTGTVSGNESCVGGIAGGIAHDMQGDISNCYTACSVIGGIRDFTGGIAGSATNIKNCYAIGKITGGYSCGGIVGYNYGTVSGCVALNPSITGSNYLGRVVGQNFSTTAKLTNNAGLKTMTVNGGTISNVDDTSINGKNIIKEDATKKSTYEEAPYSWAFGNSDTAPWKWSIGNYTLPVFYWQTNAPDMPAHLKP